MDLFSWGSFCRGGIIKQAAATVIWLDKELQPTGEIKCLCYTQCSNPNYEGSAAGNTH